MRTLKLGAAIFVGLDLLLLGSLAAGYAIDVGLFGFARLVTGSSNPDLPTPSLVFVGVVIGVGIAAAVAVGLRGVFRNRPPRRLVTAGVPAVLAVLLAFQIPAVYGEVTTGILVGEATAAAVAAVRPACAGTAVPAAGHLLTGPGAVNHVVALDRSGGDHGWSGSPPAEWSARTVGDIELVLCMDPSDEFTTDQVCGYSGGPDVTRHTATRAVRVVEPSTATTLTTLTVDHPARECGKTEDVELTDLYGAVEWSDVQAAVTTWLVSNDAWTPTASP